jgi:hypothetical protein
MFLIIYKYLILLLLFARRKGAQIFSDIIKERQEFLQIPKTIFELFVLKLYAVLIKKNNNNP